jgi:hypothetical protein
MQLALTGLGAREYLNQSLRLGPTEYNAYCFYSSMTYLKKKYFIQCTRRPRYMKKIQAYLILYSSQIKILHPRQDEMLKKTFHATVPLKYHSIMACRRLQVVNKTNV